MQNEHYLNYIGISSEYIKSYMAQNNNVSEFTCLVPKDDQSVSSVLHENGFRYCGKRLVDGKTMTVFKWFQGLDKSYEDMRSFFNRRVHDYDLHMSDGFDSYETTFISLFQDIPCTDDKIAILDLGCGTGAELRFIFQKTPNAYVVCMDVAEVMLLKLHEKYSDYSNNIETICTSYLGYDFGQKRYEYVVACNTLHHLLAEDKLNLYVSINKGLKDKGCLLIFDYITTSLQEEQSLRTSYLGLVSNGVIEKNEIYHIDLPLTMEHEVELLKASGFTCTRTEKEGEKGLIISARKSVPGKQKVE